MKTKQEIVANWLPRYTKRKLEDFGEYILLTNFNNYVEIFAEKFNVPILGKDANMISATAEGITIINFGMGSPNAAIIMDLLGAINPKACLFLGKCGGIDKKNKLGDLILPIAAIRGEGTSNTHPRASWSAKSNNVMVSSRFLEDASYLRLKNVQLGYTFALKSKLISNLRVYGSATNLLTFTKYSGLDPEMTVSANSASEGDKANGIDWGTYPVAKTFTLGVNLTF